MWGPARHNWLDPALFPMIGYNSRKIYEAAFGLDPEERFTKELLLKVISRYDESLAELPYF